MLLNIKMQSGDVSYDYSGRNFINNSYVSAPGHLLEEENLYRSNSFQNSNQFNGVDYDQDKYQQQLLQSDQNSDSFDRQFIAR